MAYQLPVGLWPLFGEKETTAVAFTGFSNPGSLERRKKNLPLKRTKKGEETAPNQHHQWTFLSVSDTYTLSTFLSCKHTQSFPLSVGGRMGLGGWIGGKQRGNPQVRLLLSPVSLLEAMKDAGRVPSTDSAREPPVSLRPPVDRAAKWVPRRNVNQRIWHVAGDLASGLSAGLSDRWLCLCGADLVSGLRHISNLPPMLSSSFLWKFSRDWIHVHLVNITVRNKTRLCLYVQKKLLHRLRAVYTSFEILLLFPLVAQKKLKGSKKKIQQQ